MAATGPSNIPVASTAYFDARDDVDRVHLALCRSRVVTLVGAAGVGKTRLALEVADAHADSWPAGRWFVALAEVDDDALVAARIADAVGIAPPPGSSLEMALSEVLGDQPALLVIDNCEHVIDAAAACAAALAARCRALTVLATSRQPLGLVGESLLPLTPLPVDSPGDGRLSDAVALFADRARRAFPELHVDDAMLPLLEDICRRLDGLPLALELAAAQLRGLTPDQLLAHLRDDVLALPLAVRGGPAHHATLTAALDRSLAQLSRRDRRLLGALSVFAGPFDVAAAAAIAGADMPHEETVRALGRLTERSIVLRDGERHRLLHVVREHARRHLPTWPRRRRMRWRRSTATGSTRTPRGRHAAC